MSGSHPQKSILPSFLPPLILFSKKSFKRQNTSSYSILENQHEIVFFLFWPLFYCPIRSYGRTRSRLTMDRFYIHACVRTRILKSFLLSTTKSHSSYGSNEEFFYVKSRARRFYYAKQAENPVYLENCPILAHIDFHTRANTHNN